MWDWSGSKNPPPYKGRDPDADDALDQGVTPEHPASFGYRRDPRIIPYNDPRERREENKEADEGYSIPPFVPIHEGVSLNQETASMAPSAGGGSLLAQARQSSLAQPDEPVPFADFSRPSIVDASGDAGIWEWQFSQFNLGGMELKEIDINLLDTNTRGEMRRAFKRARRDFIRYIAYYNESDITAAGIDETGLRNLKKGKVPENFDVHLKIPFDYGGTNDFANLLLIQTHPYHDDVHKFIDMQTTSQPFGCHLSKLFIPVYEGKVYVPSESSSIGGGKGKGDKTSVQGYSASALQQMAVKNMMDRGAKL